MPSTLTFKKEALQTLSRASATVGGKATLGPDQRRRKRPLDHGEFTLTFTTILTIALDRGLA
jgi:hypothetical protein